VSSTSRLRIGVSNNFMKPDTGRVFYPHSRLLYVDEAMVGWVSRSGALAYAVPTSVPPAGTTTDAYAEDLDGLVLSGGADVCPRSYGEEPVRPEWEGDEPRDRYEIELVRAFLAAGKPVLGICRGHQLLNVALGGSLWQDLHEGLGTEREHRSQTQYHRQVHDIDLVDNTGLAALHPGVVRTRVNSIHHQAIKDLGPGLVTEAVSSDDGVIEAVRLDGDGWAVGVQWHPEFAHRVEGDPAGDGMLDDGPMLEQFLDEARRAAATGR
jgi:putative glutamine amidotransferase